MSSKYAGTCSHGIPYENRCPLCEDRQAAVALAEGSRPLTPAPVFATSYEAIDAADAVPDRRSRNAVFWERNDIRGAMNALDVWASCIHARVANGTVGVPTFEAIFEAPRVETEWYDEIACLRQIEEVSERTNSMRAAAPARLLCLAIEGVLKQAGASATCRALLLTLYPRTGTYQRSAYGAGVEIRKAQDSILRRFRPSALYHMFGREFSPSMQGRIDAILGQQHREAVQEVADTARLPADVFEREILQIRTPAAASRERAKEGRFEPEFRGDAAEYVAAQLAEMKAAGLDSTTPEIAEIVYTAMYGYCKVVARCSNETDFSGDLYVGSLESAVRPNSCDGGSNNKQVD